MSIKVKNICIDGIDKTKKSYIIKEMRKFLKEKRSDEDFYAIKGCEDKILTLQEVLLEESPNMLILKEDSVLSLMDLHLEEGCGILSLEASFEEILRKERDIAQKHGSVYFFLIPESPISVADRVDATSIFLNLTIRCDFFKNIKSYTISHGLNIELVYFDEEDKIYDIRDKILKILEEKYKI